MTVFDVPAGDLISRVAKDFRQRVQRPAWSGYVKTGTSRERAPQNPDWFFVRMASVLYRVYADGPVGTESLRSYYGGRKRRGVRTEHFRKAGGKIIRTCLQNLEKEGLIKKVEKGKGRKISGKGEAYLNAKAKEIFAELGHRREREAAAAQPKGAEKGAKPEAAHKAEPKKEPHGQEGRPTPKPAERPGAGEMPKAEPGKAGGHEAKPSASAGEKPGERAVTGGKAGEKAGAAEKEKTESAAASARPGGEERKK